MKVRIICNGTQLNKREDLNPFGVYIPDVDDTISIVDQEGNEKDYCVVKRCFKLVEIPNNLYANKELIIKVIE